MIMNIPGVCSQYLINFVDSDGNPYDGSKTYKVTPPQWNSCPRVLVADSV